MKKYLEQIYFNTRAEAIIETNAQKSHFFPNNSWWGFLFFLNQRWTHYKVPFTGLLYWLLSYSFRTSLATKSKLPTKSVVLSRSLAIQKESVSGATDIFREILMELKEVWEKAAIPIKADSNCLNDIKKLHGSWKAILKIPVDKRKKRFCLI